jgi:hypothetical protein
MLSAGALWASGNREWLSAAIPFPPGGWFGQRDGRVWPRYGRWRVGSGGFPSPGGGFGPGSGRFRRGSVGIFSGSARLRLGNGGFQSGNLGLGPGSGRFWRTGAGWEAVSKGFRPGNKGDFTRFARFSACTRRIRGANKLPDCSTLWFNSGGSPPGSLGLARQNKSSIL